MSCNDVIPEYLTILLIESILMFKVKIQFEIQLLLHVYISFSFLSIKWWNDITITIYSSLNHFHLIILWILFINSWYDNYILILTFIYFSKFLYYFYPFNGCGKKISSTFHWSKILKEFLRKLLCKDFSIFEVESFLFISI